MKNNTHRLTQDWGMYFNGTFVFTMEFGEARCMYVENVERKDGGDDRDLDGMDFIGTVYNIHGQVEYTRWSADMRDEFRPLSGYYDVDNSGSRDTFVTYSSPNRTQRKGLDSRYVLFNGLATGQIEGRQLARIYAQGQEMNSRPGNRDFYTDRNQQLHWKGMHVGAIREGVFVALDNHKNKEAMLWQLLQTI